MELGCKRSVKMDFEHLHTALYRVGILGWYSVYSLVYREILESKYTFSSEDRLGTHVPRCLETCQPPR